ncbi:MAG: tripartite tricarboxylate transporter substrate binding protein [Alphaproteobacteria bacterium]|nr:MAG: tripartite tricarboxylate transporter substrate binding protein [Alphaproteobacteria bacterium]
MQPCRRRFLRLAGAAAGLPLAARMTAAQAYPTRPVRIIVPFTAGGPATVMAHVIAQPLSESWGQSFYVENLPTGASNVGSATAAKSPPDGYTLLVVTPSFVINPSLYAKLAYDPIRDFTPVILAVASPHVLLVNPSFPAKNVKELVALVKANPGKYSYASAGTGQSAQLAAELFKLAFGLDIVHVPFNGGAPAVNSTMGGHTQMAFNALPSAAALIKEGKLRALAVTSGERAPEFPDVPTLAEAGAPGQESLFFQGIVAPAGTPKDIVDQLYREIEKILARPEVKDRLAAIGFGVTISSPEEFQVQLKAEAARWAKVIRDANIKRIE